jgi:hypothetical protein
MDPEQIQGISNRQVMALMEKLSSGALIRRTSDLLHERGRVEADCLLLVETIMADDMRMAAKVLARVTAHVERHQ